MPALLSAIVDAFGGRSPGSKREEEPRFDEEQQARFDAWMDAHLEKVQAEGGAVSNMVIQARGGKA